MSRTYNFVGLRRVLLAWCAIVLAAVFVLSSTAPVAAQGQQDPGNGFRLSPVRVETEINKGASETVQVIVENPTGSRLTAEAVVNNFIASEDESGEPRLILDENAPQPPNDFRELVGQLPRVTLDPGQKQEINVNVSIPQDAESGGYYGAVRFLPIDTSGDGNVALTASVGTIFLVRVPGNLTEKLDLVEFSAASEGAPKSFFTGGDVDMLIRLENVGNIHVQPFGKVQIKNLFGNVVHEYEMNSTDPRANILPNSIRSFEKEIEKPNKGWFGRYTVTANIGYSQGSGDLITATTSFWYLPVWFLIALGVAILLIAFAVYWFFFRNKR